MTTKANIMSVWERANEVELNEGLTAYPNYNRTLSEMAVTLN